MDRQSIYHKVRKHLLAQMEHSRENWDHSCAYRGEFDRKCAIGCLIPNTLYDRSMEGSTIFGLIRRWPTIKVELGVESEEDTTFLTDLQQIHDMNQPAKWKEKLDEFGIRYKLTTPA